MDIHPLNTIAIELSNGIKNNLSIPYIHPKAFHKIMERFDTYASAYNSLANEMRQQGANHAQTLKSTHRALFQALVNIVKGKLEWKRKMFQGNNVIDLSIDANEPYILLTNNKEIGRRTGKDASTVYRNIQRLMDAGIILAKIGHGTRADYELHINPTFLLIDDYMQSQNAHEIEAAERGLAAKCKPIKNNKNILNNIIIPVNAVDKSGVGLAPNHLQENRQEQLQEHGRTSKLLDEVQHENQSFSAKTQEKQEQETPAERYEKRLAKVEEVKKLMATWFIQYMLQMLFPTHKHYKGAVLNALEYAAEVYYTGCKTVTELNNRQSVLLWRVDAAARWAKRTNFNFDNIYITTYLDINNRKSGFVNTLKWWKKHKDYQNKKRKLAIDKKRKTDMQKLSAVINKLDAIYLQGNTKEVVKEYIRAESYMKRNIPHLANDFYHATTYIRENWYNAFIPKPSKTA